MKQLLEKLAAEPTFDQMREWRVVPLHGDTVIRLSQDGSDYVAKLAKPNEVEAHRKLLRLNLRHVATSVFPALLDTGVLVTRYVHGGPIRDPRLEPALVREMAQVQNALVPERLPSDAERVSWQDYVLNAMETGRLKLAQLRPSAPVDALTALVRTTSPAWRSMASDYASMPFGWLHYDFNESNILGGPPQTVIDWGSSHGSGPFLHDMARFCLVDDETLFTFRETSDLCRKPELGEVRRWLQVAAFANLATTLRHLEVYEKDLNRIVPFYQSVLG
ncbi:MAG TPA: phosphotransferase [Fimbriimonas sp.]